MSVNNTQNCLSCLSCCPSSCCKAARWLGITLLVIGILLAKFGPTAELANAGAALAVMGGTIFILAMIPKVIEWVKKCREAKAEELEEDEDVQAAKQRTADLLELRQQEEAQKAALIQSAKESRIKQKPATEYGFDDIPSQAVDVTSPDLTNEQRRQAMEQIRKNLDELT